MTGRVIQPAQMDSRYTDDFNEHPSHAFFATRNPDKGMPFCVVRKRDHYKLSNHRTLPAAEARAGHLDLHGKDTEGRDAL